MLQGWTLMPGWRVLGVDTLVRLLDLLHMILLLLLLRSLLEHRMIPTAAQWLLLVRSN